jgi:predicted dehydrogenase
MGAAIIVTAPHDHAERANKFLSAGWHVLIEKPAALTLEDAEAVADKAAKMQRQAWVGLVYLFAPYLSVMRPFASGATHWRLEWFEAERETRWGALKSTPHHVNLVEDVFSHAWSILRGAGLAAPLRIVQVSLPQPWSARINLVADKADVEMVFDRHGGYRRRYLRIEAADRRICELDFSTEPGVFKIDGVCGGDVPWNPAKGPLTLELSAFLAACCGHGSPDLPVAVSQNLEATALMETAAKTHLELQANMVANMLCHRGSHGGGVRILFDALCREAAMSGLRFSVESDEGQAVTAAAAAFLDRQDDAFAELPGELATIARRSPFLTKIRQQRELILAGST